MDKNTLKEGTPVQIISTGQLGTVRIPPDRRGRLSVLVGAMTMQVKVADVRVRELPQTKKQEPKRVQSKLTGGPACIRIDLHGQTVEESLQLLESTLNKALLGGTRHIEIVHGIGTGKVRNAVTKYLSESNIISSFSLSPYNPGLTIVYL